MLFPFSTSHATFFTVKLKVRYSCFGTLTREVQRYLTLAFATVCLFVTGHMCVGIEDGTSCSSAWLSSLYGNLPRLVLGVNQANYWVRKDAGSLDKRFLKADCGEMFQV